MSNMNSFSRYPVQNILVVAFNKSIADELNARLRLPRSLPPRTDYVRTICEKVMERAEHLTVEALAGTGKTTTILQILSDFPGANKRAQTLHGFGYSALNFHLKKTTGSGEIKVDDKKVSSILRNMIDAQNPKQEEMIAPAARLISLMKSQGHLAFLPEATDEEMWMYVEKYGVELPEDRPGPDFVCTTEELFALARKGLTANNNNIGTIDYDDMIYMPIFLNVKFLWNELILVDESQDLNPIQIEMVRRAANGRAQCVFVGDENQSIYGFRGADVEAMQSIHEKFRTEKLPLSTCWRCAKNVIAQAQEIVPAIEHAPNAEDGYVGELRSHDEMVTMAEPGDFVLCRTTAPLVDCCMKFIRSGKAATVRGRDIGKGLETLVDKIARSRVAKGENLIEKITQYREAALAKLAHPTKEAQYQSLSDKLDTILVLAEECGTFPAIKEKIERIFSDAQNGDLKGLVLCSTAHKSKGLEADRVFIIHPEKMPLPCRQSWQKKQESNLKYVAITRAKKELYWVDNPKDKDAEPMLRPKRKTRSKKTAL